MEIHQSFPRVHIHVDNTGKTGGSPSSPDFRQISTCKSRGVPAGPAREGHVPWAPVSFFFGGGGGGAKSAERAGFLAGHLPFLRLFMPSAPSPQGAWFVSTPAAGRQVWPSVWGSKTIAM